MGSATMSSELSCYALALVVLHDDVSFYNLDYSVLRPTTFYRPLVPSASVRLPKGDFLFQAIRDAAGDGVGGVDVLRIEVEVDAGRLEHFRLGYCFFQYSSAQFSRSGPRDLRTALFG